MAREFKRVTRDQFVAYMLNDKTALKPVFLQMNDSARENNYYVTTQRINGIKRDVVIVDRGKCMWAANNELIGLDEFKIGYILA